MTLQPERRESVEGALRGERSLDLPPKTAVVPLGPGGDHIAARYEREGWIVVRVDPSRCS